MLKPGWPAGLLFMTTQAGMIREFRGFYIRVLDVRLAHPVAGFTPKCLVRELGLGLKDLRVALVALLPPCEHRRARGDFLQCLRAVPAEGPERDRSQNLPENQVTRHNDERHKKQADDLRRYFQPAHTNLKGTVG